MTNFPTSQPGLKNDFDSTDPVASADQNDSANEVNAIGAKLGIGATTPTTTNKILYGSATGTSAWATPDTAGIVDKTSAQTLTNKTLTSPAVTGLTGTLASPVITTPQINDTSSDHQYITAVSELAADRTVTLPLLTGNDEFVFKDHTQTLTNKTLTTPYLTDPMIDDLSSTHQYIFSSAELAANRVISLPLLTGADTFVFEDHTQTLENKTLTKPVINGTNPTGATYTPATGAQEVALDCAANNLHVVTGHASGTAITFTVANATNNQPFIVSILQGAVVSTITAWFDTVRWAGGSAPTLTATAAKRDTFGFIRTGSATYDGFIIGQNA